MLLWGAGMHVEALIFRWSMQGESLWREDQGQLPLARHPNPCLQLEQAACIQCQQEQPGELRWLSLAVAHANSGQG